MADNSRKTYSSKRYYVDGNTVREINPEEERRQRRIEREREEQRKKRVRRNAARRNREKALHMSRAYVAFLTGCVIVSAFAAGLYIHEQAKLTNRMHAVSALESQVTDLKTDNDARLKRIETSVDLDYVKDVAINQLGMKYANEGQVVYYTVDNSNYMNQYSDIPQK